MARKDKDEKKAPESSSDPRSLSAAAARDLFLKSRASVKNSHKVLKIDQKEEVVPYGLIALDHCCALGGMPARGRVVHIHGPEHTGKSSLGYTFLRNYQRQTGRPIAIMDHEQTLNNEYLGGIGLDLELAEIYLPDTIEEAAARTIELMDMGVRVFMYDSIPRMKPKIDVKEILNGDAFSAQVGVHARAMSRFFDAMLPHFARTNSTMILINQTRSRIESSNEARMASKYPTYWNLDYTLPGGRSVRYYTSVMIETKIRKAYKRGDKDTEWLIEGGDPKKETRFAATEIKTRILKNKVNSGGYRSGTLWMRPNRGFDDNISIREMARQYKLINNAGALFYVGESKDSAIKVYNNKADAIQDLVVDENPDVLSRLREMVVEKIKTDSSFEEAVDQATLDYMSGESESDGVGDGQAPKTEKFDVDELDD